jgi:hypothetical protein
MPFRTDVRNLAKFKRFPQMDSHRAHPQIGFKITFYLFCRWSNLLRRFELTIIIPLANLAKYLAN